MGSENTGKPMIDDSTNARRRYTSVYAFDGYLRAEHPDVITLITETVTEMQGEGIDIEFLGATREFDSAGRATEVTVRYAAPNKGGQSGDSTVAPVCRPAGSHDGKRMIQHRSPRAVAVPFRVLVSRSAERVPLPCRFSGGTQRSQPKRFSIGRAASAR